MAYGAQNALYTVQFYIVKKVQQNFPWIPTVGCFKLVICPSSCAGIEFGQFRPSEIWQP